MQYNSVSILGCGWLGLPLAARIRRESPAVKVRGSTTTPGKLEQLSAAGIEAYLIRLAPGIAGEAPGFFDSDGLVVNFPPRLAKTAPGFYLSQIRALTERIRLGRTEHIVFVSSTSVYPGLSRQVCETDVVLPGASASPLLVEAEQLMQALRPERTVTVLRLGGLMGYERIPGKYVRGQKDLSSGRLPVNYIHRDDAAGILVSMLDKGLVNDTFNGVAPLHPARREVYEASCRLFGWEPPTYAEPPVPPGFKIVCSDKLRAVYGYDFKYPDPLGFHYAEREA